MPRLDVMEDNSVAKAILTQELRRLASEGGGTLHPASVVDDARSPASPLHQYFEWDDSLAAETYRLNQARTLIRSVRVSVTIEETVIRIPYFVRNADLEVRRAGYCSLLEIDDNEQKLRVITEQLRIGMSHLKRAGSIALAIDNATLHAAISLEVSRIERYLNTIKTAGRKEDDGQ